MIIGQEYEYKCKKDDRNLVCNPNYQEFNISLEFQYLSQTLNESDKSFFGLTIINSYIEEIPENTFLDIFFHSLDITNVTSLNRISSNMFNINTSSHMTQSLKIEKPTKLVNNPTNFDLYKALGSLVKVRTINIALGDGSEHIIPDNAFQSVYGSQNDLVSITFTSSQYSISRIGSNPFSKLPNLATINFHDIPISAIDAKAFDFDTSSEKILTINLTNCDLTESKLEVGVFFGSKRPLTLDLSKNNIIYF